MDRDSNLLSFKHGSSVRLHKDSLAVYFLCLNVLDIMHLAELILDCVKDLVFEALVTLSLKFENLSVKATAALM